MNEQTFIHRPVLIEREAERMAIACDFGVSEWEAFVGLAERKLIAEGVIAARASVRPKETR